MKYLLKILSMLIVISMLMLITSIPVAAEESNVNAELDARDRQIEELMQARQELVSSENPDLFELNEIDLQLIELGVEFLDAEEVQ